MPRPSLVSTRNARFQQWQALLLNRAKRQRAGRFLVQGVRPISQAVAHGWHIEELLCRDGQRLSGWATELLERAAAPHFAVAPELLAELGERAEGVPELLAVVRMPPDDLRRIAHAAPSLVVVFDRPVSPGNIGTLVRSADAFGASGVVLTGHAADVYDPKAVRASTGSLFATPVVRVPSHREVLEWVDGAAAVVGMDEKGTVDVAERDLTVPTVLVIGNETSGLSAAWRDACDEMLRIPIGGAASSLNAASAGTVALYEAARQRRRVQP